MLIDRTGFDNLAVVLLRSEGNRDGFHDLPTAGELDARGY
jgi:hypothetical protein